jgi:hypothetical protein
MIQKRVSKMLFSNQEKVELALVDDIKTAISKGTQIEKQLKRDLLSYNGLLRAAGMFDKNYNELLQKAKELGVEPPSELKGLVDIAKGFEKKGQAIKKAYNLF